MKKKNLKSLKLNKKVVSELRGGALEKNNELVAMSYLFWCTIEVDCPSVVATCDMYCTLC